FYFTGSAIFFSLIGIILLIEIKIDFQHPIILSSILLYTLLDLFRMGNIDNCANYLYNRISNDRATAINKNIINELKNIKPNNNNVLIYSNTIFSKSNLNHKITPFIVTALSETATIGHKPNWDFYLSSEYGKNYPVLLPKNHNKIPLVVKQ
ncbi:MAG: hypothetical protein ACK448_06410, partial [Bacteroidota bacterium]